MNQRRARIWAGLALAFLLVPLCLGGGRLAAQEVAAASAATGEGGRLYAVLIGISDYPGEANDLAYTAEDAYRVRDALSGAGMGSEDAVVLTDDAATINAVQHAFQVLAGRMGPDDRFIFFYSGHGNQVQRTETQPADPDMLDETLELYDGPVTDDQLNEMFSHLNVGISLIVIDASFSGGFAPDLISTPGRMGLFSSEEDMPSTVAADFHAGGYLAVFLSDAVADGGADTDGDGNITALELSQYVHERYRAVGTGDEHVVIDRGSIGPSDVVIPLAR